MPQEADELLTKSPPQESVSSPVQLTAGVKHPHTSPRVGP